MLLETSGGTSSVQEMVLRREIKVILNHITALLSIKSAYRWDPYN